MESQFWLKLAFKAFGIFAISLAAAMTIQNLAEQQYRYVRRPTQKELDDLKNAPKVPIVSVQDLAGISQPLFISAADAAISDDESIIGIRVAGESRAYLRDSFGSMDTHIVNDLVGPVPVSVVHCNLTRCTRVFTKRQQSEHLPRRIPLRCGGWDRTQQLAVILEGERYVQTDKRIPLTDLSFTETTWSAWRTAHPDTVLYVGDFSDDVKS